MNLVPPIGLGPNKKQPLTKWVLLQVWLAVVSFGCSFLAAAVSTHGMLDDSDCYNDLLWKGRLLTEMKSRG
jgi:hypothetical protein